MKWQMFLDALMWAGVITVCTMLAVLVLVSLGIVFIADLVKLVWIKLKEK